MEGPTVSNFRVWAEEDKAKEREGVESRGRRAPRLFESEFEELGSGHPQSEEDGDPDSPDPGMRSLGIGRNTRKISVSLLFQGRETRTRPLPGASPRPQSSHA